MKHSYEWSFAVEIVGENYDGKFQSLTFSMFADTLERLCLELFSNIVILIDPLSFLHSRYLMKFLKLKKNMFLPKFVHADAPDVVFKKNKRGKLKTPEKSSSVIFSKFLTTDMAAACTSFDTRVTNF